MKTILILVSVVISALSLCAAPLDCNGNFAKIDQKANMPAYWSKNGNVKSAKFEMIKEKDGKNVLHLKTAKNAYVAAYYNAKSFPLKAGDKVTIKVLVKGACKNFTAGLYYYTKKANIQGAGVNFVLDSPNAYKEYTGSFVVVDRNKNLDHALPNFSIAIPAEIWVKSVSYDIVPAAAKK